MNTSTNSFDNFKPMNVAEAIGDTTPALPFAPPPPPVAGCNAIASIIMIVIAVVVTVYTAGAAAGATANLWGAGLSALSSATTVAGAGAAFAGGLVGSVVSQIAGKAMGVVDHFSLKSALSSGLTTMATAGMGGVLGTTGWAKTGVETGINSLGKAALAAGSTVASYAANKAVGSPASFSWKNVATSAISAYAGSEMGINKVGFDAGSEMATGVMSGTLQGIAHAGINYAVSKGLFNKGSWDFKQVATDSFGNALAHSIVNKMDQLAKDQILSNRQAIGLDVSSPLHSPVEEFDPVKAASQVAQKQRAENLSDELRFTTNSIEKQKLVSIEDVDSLGFFAGSEADAYLLQAHRLLADLNENGSLSAPDRIGRGLVGDRITHRYNELQSGNMSAMEAFWWGGSTGENFEAYYEEGLGRGPVAMAGGETHLIAFQERANAMERKMMLTDYVGGNVPVDILARYLMDIDSGTSVVDVSAGWYMSSSKSLAGYDETFYRQAYMDTNNLLSDNMFARSLELGGKTLGNALLGLGESAMKGGYFAGNTAAPRSMRNAAAFALTVEAAAAVTGVGEVLWAARAAKAARLTASSDIINEPNAVQRMSEGYFIPSDFGLKSIESNTQLHGLWTDSLKNAASWGGKKQNAYQKYLQILDNGGSPTGKELSKAFSTVQGYYSRGAQKQGIGLLGGDIHHWNFNKSLFSDQVFDPRNLFPTVNKIQHNSLHLNVGSGNGIDFTSPIIPESILNIDSSFYPLPVNYFGGK
jgi:hypothetical protein